MMIPVGYAFILLSLFIYSYAFVDLNLHLTDASWFLTLQGPLSSLVYVHMKVAGVIFVAIVAGLFMYYLMFLRKNEQDLRTLMWGRGRNFFFLMGVFFLFSFPAFTYDIFNYMTTASVLYRHHENPYVVMPIEIPNEPGLAYTRAANKVALYGPSWLGLSAIPHVAGLGNTWLTIIAFKALIIAAWGALLIVIWNYTKSMKQVAFFACNPLVITEVLVSGHNDIIMALFAVLAFVPHSFSKGTWIRILLWLASVGVKGSTIILLPLLFVRTMERTQMYKIAYWLLFAVFVVAAPFREELYPWYAVWFLPFAALIPIKKGSFIHGFSVALSMGLVLRHLPYILTREYGGNGPVLRIVFTVVPLLLYMGWYVKRFGVKSLIHSSFYA